MFSVMTFRRGDSELIFQKFSYFGTSKLCRVIYAEIYLL